MHFSRTNHHLVNLNHLFYDFFLGDISHPAAFERAAVFLVYNPLISSVSYHLISPFVSQSIFLSFLFSLPPFPTSESNF